MTSWSIPGYTRAQVDRAGEALIDPNVSIDEFVIALEVINNWRSSHSYPLLNFRLNLRRKLKGIEPGAILAQRIKRLE